MERDEIKAVGYVRVSTDSQVRHGYSLDEQREEIVRYCNNQQYALLEIFSDEGVSGAKADEDEMTVARDGLLDMLVYVKERARYIVVLSTSRLWRSDMVRVLIHRELKKCNADVKAIDRPQYSIYTQNPNEVLINGMLELLDIYERLEIALKLKRGRLQKAKEGDMQAGVYRSAIIVPTVGKTVHTTGRSQGGTTGFSIKKVNATDYLAKDFRLYESSGLHGEKREGLQSDVG